jgi:DNA primase
MARIREEDIQAVRERTDIVKVVSQYLTLKKAGHDRLVGLCPFHAEKTPSFGVSPTKQVYYCFGCGTGGTATKFLEQIESLSFAETIERLAKDAGVPLRSEAE